MRLILEIVVLTVLAAAPVAPHGNIFIKAMGALFRALALPLSIPARVSLQTAHGLRPVAKAAGQALAWPGPKGEQPPTVWLWEQIGAAFNVACFTVFGLLDWQLLSITIDSIFHLAGGPLPQIGKLTGLTIVLAAAYTAHEILSITGFSPVKRPWVFMTATWRRRLALLAAACLAATIVAGVAVAVYRQLQIGASQQTLTETIQDPNHLHLVLPPEPITSILLFTFIILMWAVLALVSAGSGLSILPLLGAVVTVLKLLAVALLFLLFVLFGLPALLIALVAMAIMLAVLLVFSVVRTTWNWAVSFPVARRLNLNPIDAFAWPPFVADDLTQPFIPSQLADFRPFYAPDKEDTTMPRNPARFVTIAGAGHWAITGIDNLQQATDLLDASRQVLATGCVTTTSPIGLQRTASGRDGVIDLTPTTAIGRNAIDRDPASLAHAQAHALIDAAIQAMIDAELAHGQLIWFQGFDADVGIAAEALQELTVRQPGETVLAVADIPAPDRHSARLADGIGTYTTLHAAYIIAATVVLDQRSPLAQAVSPEVQQLYASRVLASLIRAPRDREQNASITDIARAMGRESEAGFVGLAAASECIAPGKQVHLYASIRRLFSRLPARGKGDLDDMIKQGIAAAARAIGDPTCRALDEPIDQNKPYYLVYTLPLRSTDPRWEEYIWATSKWLAENHEAAVPIYASGPGTPDPRTPGTYWIQASVLYPLPAVPAPVRRIVERKGLVLAPEIVATHNGVAADAGPEVVTEAPVIS